MTHCARSDAYWVGRFAGLVDMFLAESDDLARRVNRRMGREAIGEYEAQRAAERRERDDRAALDEVGAS